MDMEFRYWDADESHWTFVNGHFSINNRNFKIYTLEPRDSKKNIKITQAIGHKDIDGKKLFVGDWVEITDKDSDYSDLFLILHDGQKLFVRRYMVDIKCHCENCRTNVKKSHCWTYEDLDLYYGLNNPKIVGNMFEHPNLYKERYV